ncbi:MAG: hypothetical protein IKT61_01560 [Clostridia bacterium]|nr:hypothetical protein [Clostridia bacterium]
MSNRTVEIFWTGGYDSTFRVVQLSRMDITVQPYYLSDNRLNEKYELGAIEKITALLKEHPDTKADILPTVIVPMEARPGPNELIRSAYDRIFAKNWLGNQYVWLAEFASSHKGVELSIEKGTNPVKLINANGGFKKIDDGKTGFSYAVDESITDADYLALFGNFTMPLLDVTKLDMKEFFHTNGYDEIMKATWFCHTPVNGKPCGKCNPCKGVVEEGMAERLDEEALARYRKAKRTDKFKATPIFKLAKKILRR